jgi:hypothetical protein
MAGAEPARQAGASGSSVGTANQPATRGRPGWLPGLAAAQKEKQAARHDVAYGSRPGTTDSNEPWNNRQNRRGGAGWSVAGTTTGARLLLQEQQQVSQRCGSAKLLAAGIAMRYYLT